MNKNTISRRRFVAKSAKGAAFISAGGINLLIKGCSKTADFDLLIRGGLVYDGLGNPGRQVDIAVNGDKIILLTENIDSKRARKVINATNLAVSPGFVDAHTHTDTELLANPKAESHIRQGITSEISGNCGSSPFPIADETFEEEKVSMKERYDIELDWKDLNGFFRRIENNGTALNYATLVGQGAIRGKVVGLNDEPATDQQVAEMKRLVAENIKAGAVGLSTGLEYAPGSYAKTEEIIELCRQTAACGGLYATHIRDEGDGVLEAIEETITTAKKAGVSLQISHLKTGYPANWSKIDTVLAKIEQAKKEGLDISADRYPYIAASTGLSLYFPLWARQGTTKDFVARLKDPELDDKLRSYCKEQEQKLGGWDKVLISSVFTEKNKKFEGKNILESADESGKQKYDFIRDLLIEEENRVQMVTFMMCEENLKRILAHPHVMVGSDGSAVAPYGLLGKGKPHRRLYGTFAQVLGKFTREEKIFDLPRAIQKITSMTAQKFSLTKRGQIAVGYFADLVIFDPERIADSSTWANPHQYPKGIDYVIVNGQVVISQGDHTGLLPGRILKKGMA
jgi:N-acyl-D-amino-acid deacylase